MLHAIAASRLAGLAFCCMVPTHTTPLHKWSSLYVHPVQYFMQTRDAADLCKTVGTCQACGCIACRPYDTLEEVIGLRGTPGHGSLKEWGVAYLMLPLASDGTIDWNALKTAVRPGIESSCTSVYLWCLRSEAHTACHASNCAGVKE